MPMPLSDEDLALVARLEIIGVDSVGAYLRRLTLSENPSNWRLCPVDTAGAIERYVAHHIEPGSFLRAVLSNDMRAAFMRADDLNMIAMPSIVSYLYNRTPSNCQGSPERVEAWLASSK